MWNMLENLIASNDAEWVICGDFNEVRDQSERLNCAFIGARAARFNSFIDRMQLIEIPLLGMKFTRISDNGMKLSKLDRFLVLENFMQTWGDLSVIALDRNTSDHCPIVLQNKNVDFGPKPFKIFDEWLEKVEVEHVMSEAWNKQVTRSRHDCIFRNKLKNVKKALRSWSKVQYDTLDTELDNAKKRAGELEKKAESQQLTETERDEWLNSRGIWLKKEREKAQMLKQKARIKWAIDGDENSRLFHSSIKRRNNSSNIRGLYINGEWQENPVGN
ncbi:uncharacterized protein [Rutidosis leptorrhynchoides]|uniref:uncharacterized protein n=1 Tax=Rutidosis leptorrhynchoides TaxID=125765 RepID=UPI003A98EBAF